MPAPDVRASARHLDGAGHGEHGREHPERERGLCHVHGRAPTLEAAAGHEHDARGQREGGQVDDHPPVPRPVADGRGVAEPHGPDHDGDQDAEPEGGGRDVSARGQPERSGHEDESAQGEHHRGQELAAPDRPPGDGAREEEPEPAVRQVARDDRGPAQQGGGQDEAGPGREGGRVARNADHRHHEGRERDHGCGPQERGAVRHLPRRDGEKGPHGCPPPAEADMEMKICSSGIA